MHVSAENNFSMYLLSTFQDCNNINKYIFPNVLIKNNALFNKPIALICFSKYSSTHDLFKIM